MTARNGFQSIDSHLRGDRIGRYIDIRGAVDI